MLITKSWMKLGVPGWIWGSQHNPGRFMFSWVSPRILRPFLGVPSLTLKFCLPSCPEDAHRGLRVGCSLCHPGSKGRR